MTMNPKNVRFLIFDFDGTVGDSYAAVTESINHAFRRLGERELSVDEVRPWVGTGLENVVEHFLGKARVELAVRLFREHYVTICNEKTSLMPGAREALDALDGRFIMALTSNKHGAILRGICKALDIDRHFAVVLGDRDVARIKPHPEMLVECLRRLGATAHDTLYVGDTDIDATFASSCGVPFVLILGGTGTREQLLGTKPVALLDTISELPHLLGR
jgi:HAD superfamily hydrolase (TIGR01509 family)